LKRCRIDDEWFSFFFFFLFPCQINRWRQSQGLAPLIESGNKVIIARPTAAAEPTTRGNAAANADGDSVQQPIPSPTEQQYKISDKKIVQTEDGVVNVGYLQKRLNEAERELARARHELLLLKLQCEGKLHMQQHEPCPTATRAGDDEQQNDNVCLSYLVFSLTDKRACSNNCTNCQQRQRQRKHHHQRRRRLRPATLLATTSYFATAPVVVDYYASTTSIRRCR
jgi:hypothetical protein